MFEFEVDNASDLPLWVQLRNRLIFLINSGYYKPGDQLPTVRGLASEISINYNTVNKAYLSLMNDGYIKSTRGRGAFVLDPDDDDDLNSSAELLIEDCIEACLELGLSFGDISKQVIKTLRKMEKDRHSKRTSE